MKDSTKHFIQVYRHRLLIGVFCFAAIVLSFLANFSCQFVQVNLLTSDDWDVPDTDKYQNFGLGLWQRETGDDNSEKCVLWTPSQEFYDASWKGSRVFAVVTCILGVASLFFHCWATCIQSRCVEKSTSCLLLVSMAFQIATFSCYGSTVCTSDFEQCQWNQGSTFSLVAAVLYMICGVHELMLPKCETRIRKQEKREEEEKSENLTATMKARAYLAKRDADQALEQENNRAEATTTDLEAAAGYDEKEQ